MAQRFNFGMGGRVKRRWQAVRTHFAIEADFDAAFYADYHPDLQHLRTRGDLWRHYENHGRMEGRAPNWKEALRALEERHGSLPATFTVPVYRMLNEDLAGIFVTDYQYVRHFLENGRREGRPFEVANADPASGLPEGPWQVLFRPAEFAAMAQDWLPHPPRTKPEMLQVFAMAGVPRLAPIRFTHSFDPLFYRQAYDLDPDLDASSLYRDWLEHAAQRAPNERLLLYPYLGERDFPVGFDWKAYGAQLPRGHRAAVAHRWQALMHLFDHPPLHSPRELEALGFEMLAAIGDYQLRRGRMLAACEVCDQAEKTISAPLTAAFLSRRGKARKARSPTEALSDFFAAIKVGGAPWEAVHMAVEILTEQGRFDEAFALLRQVAPEWRRVPEFLECARRAVEARYDFMCSSAMGAYAAGQRAQADSSVFQILQKLCDLIQDLEPLPPLRAARPDGPIMILANQELPQCTFYRVEQKLRLLAHAGLEARAFRPTEIEAFITALLPARAAVFYRVPATPAVLRALLYARALGIPTYYEIDDLIFDASDFPDTFESYEGQITSEEYCGLQLGVPLHRFAMSLCQKGIASTPSLAGALADIVATGEVVLLRNGLDQRSDAAIARAAVARAPQDTVTLFYGTGTKAHSLEFTRDLAPALIALLDAHDYLRLVLVGYLQLGAEFERYRSRIVQVGFIADLDAYWALLAACDINLAVLSPGRMTDCKSEIKWLEAAALGVPSVVTATATYGAALSHGVDGLLVETPDQWISMLDTLIRDGALRRSIGGAARAKALLNYGLAPNSRRLADALAKGDEIRVSSGKRPIRVLICHVFFSPQSYGGATRVVEENVDYLIENCPDIEVSVFTTDEGRRPVGNLRCESYRGRPVYRISPAVQKLREWQPFDDEMATVFEKVLEAAEPDLVHFHCIQRLTASIVQVCAQAQIPYIVTLHDGWWISDSQFFIDRDGAISLPANDPLTFCRIDDVDLPHSLWRRQALARLLEGAKHVLAVSPSFAKLHQEAGIKSASWLANGVPAIEAKPRRPRGDGRLVLGHLGGRSIQKGAVLVEAVLRKGHFDRLALVMIDNALAADVQYEVVWGLTHVTLRGPCPQAKIADLYAELDVLLAPSLWPESFGLVSREAASLGLNIIASNRGAIGDGIMATANVVVIDVGSDKPLADVLTAMNQNTEGWRARDPLAQGRLRRSSDQGRDLANLYRDIRRAPSSNAPAQIGDGTDADEPSQHANQ
ncbi:glycosyltransferase [Labrys okinawensis]|uniref:glycosyltransferase n=1 Tax=Labrys okinawensis TaxID=346911 RepID=UPI0039BD73C6